MSLRGSPKPGLSLHLKTIDPHVLSIVADLERGGVIGKKNISGLESEENT